MCWWQPSSGDEEKTMKSIVYLIVGMVLWFELETWWYLCSDLWLVACDVTCVYYLWLALVLYLSCDWYCSACTEYLWLVCDLWHGSCWGANTNALSKLGAESEESMRRFEVYCRLLTHLCHVQPNWVGGMTCEPWINEASSCHTGSNLPCAMTVWHNFCLMKISSCQTQSIIHWMSGCAKGWSTCESKLCGAQAPECQVKVWNQSQVCNMTLMCWILQV